MPQDSLDRKLTVRSPSRLSRLATTLVLALRLIPIAEAAGSAAAGAVLPPPPIPRAAMKTMARNLARVLPLVVSDEAFDKPANRRVIFRGLMRMATAAHTVEEQLPKSNEDPLIGFVTMKLSSHLEHAANALAYGHPNQARGMILSATSYCISCHTRTAGGEATIALEPAAEGVALSPLVKAEFYAATRQFDKAIIQYELVLGDQAFASHYPQRWELAAKKMLAIVVRTQNSPRLTLELLARIRDAKTPPAALSRDSLYWHESAKNWLAESETPASTGVADALLERAKRLYQAGDDLVLKSGATEAGLILFLRASADLHSFLQQRHEPQVEASGLLYAGQTAQRLAALNLWTLSDSYFEACVRTMPHSETARQCFERFRLLQSEQAPNLGKGPVLSRDAERRLSELATLSR